MKQQRRNLAVPTFTPFQGAQVSRMPTPRAGQVSLGGMPSAPSGGGQDWFSQLLTQKLAGAVNAGIDNLWDAYVTQGIFGVEPPEVPGMPQGGGGYDLSGWSPQQQAQSYQGATQPQASRPVQEKTLLDFIAGPESGGRYDVAYGGATMPAGLTVDEAIAWGRQHGKKTGSSAMGRYQFLSNTLSGLKDKMGLAGNESFSPELQDAMAVELMRGRGLDKFKAGDLSAEEFAANLAKEWAGLPAGSHGRSYYHGDKMGNAAGVGWNDLLAAIRGEREVDTRTASTTPTPGEIPMNSSMMYDADIIDEVRQEVAKRPDIYGGTAFDPAVPEQGRFAEEGPLVTPPAVPADTGAESASYPQVQPQAQQAPQQQPQGQTQNRGWRSLFDTGPGTSGYMMVPGQEAAVPFVRTGPRNQAIPDTSGLPQVGQAQQMAPAPQQMPVGAPQSAPQPQGLPQQPPGPQAPQSGGDGFWANLFGVPQRRREVAAQQLAMGKTFMDLQNAAREQFARDAMIDRIAQEDPGLATLMRGGYASNEDVMRLTGYGKPKDMPAAVQEYLWASGGNENMARELWARDKIKAEGDSRPDKVKVAEYMFPGDPEGAKRFLIQQEQSGASATVAEAWQIFPTDSPEDRAGRAEYVRTKTEREVEKTAANAAATEGIKIAAKDLQQMQESERNLQEQLTADARLLAEFEKGSYDNKVGFGRAYITRWTDPNVGGELQRYSTETAMRALNTVNVAPVSNFEFQAMQKLSANDQLTVEQNKKLLRAVIAIRKGQLEVIAGRRAAIGRGLSDRGGSNYLAYMADQPEIQLPPDVQAMVDALENGVPIEEIAKGNLGGESLYPENTSITPSGGDPRFGEIEVLDDPSAAF